MASFPNFCRLCLQKFTGPCRILNKDPKAISMVKHLFPGMDIDLVKTSKICCECFKYIQFAYKMRETVINNEQKIKSNIDSVGEIKGNTCRLCLNRENIEAKVLLYENANSTTIPFLEARNIIEIAILDVSFEIFQKPVACNNCWQIVKSIYLFKKRCFATEKILKFYCTKNNLTSLTDKEIESVSTCYNSNLEKFSKAENHNLSANLISNKTIERAQQVTLASVNNFIKPVDVYLNNFTTDEEDDIFEEEVDDIFVESPKTFKGDVSELLVDAVKHVLEKPSDNNIDEISKRAKQVKEEQARSLNIASKYHSNKEVRVIGSQQNIKSKGVIITPIKSTKCSQITLAEKKKALNKKKNSESGIDRREEIDNGSNLGISDCVLKPSHKAIENKDKEYPKVYFDKDGNIEWRCVKCAFKTKYKQHLRRHSLVHIEKPKLLTCPKCVYSSHIQRNFDRHMKRHSSIHLIPCATCGYVTAYKSNLKKHMLIHKRAQKSSPNEGCRSDENTVQPKKPLGFSCKECPFVTRREEQIISHLRTHRSTEKIFNCTKCPYITTRAHSLKEHMELHSKDSLKKKFKCDSCSFSGRRKTDLQSHMLSHQQGSKFSCSQCSYKAKRKSHLVTHMLRHQTGNKKVMFQCPYCNYKSTRKEHLRQHCRIKHFDKEEINCNEVQVIVTDSEYSFIKDKTITCPYCPYKQYRRYASTMDVHIFTMHFPSASEQMHCNDCPYLTNKRKAFLDHVHLHHSKKKRK